MDDSLIVGKASEHNVWGLKAILRCFELMSGLKVNFQKSDIIGINVEDHFLEAAASSFNCKICMVPFIYLGITLGANPRLAETWQSMVDKLRRRLSNWKRRNLSLGGRIVLINSVLTNLPIYYLSFMKAPKKVIKEMISIQRNFLWGGTCERKGIAWVKWSEVCRSKSSGGLGIKDIQLFNLSLLGKWLWRIARVEKSL